VEKLYFISLCKQRLLAIFDSEQGVATTCL